MKKQWKTLARPMFSMNLWFSRKSSGWSQEILWKFMENIGQANVFHEFMVFQRISEVALGKVVQHDFFLRL